MLDTIQRFFERRISEVDDRTSAGSTEHAYRLATAALLVEMTRADYEVKAAEQTAVLRAIKEAFELTDAETRELLDMAESEADQATSLYEFTRIINGHFTAKQKEHVVELLWLVAYADGELDKYEEHLVRRIADLIYVTHSTFIRTKLDVRNRVAAGGKE